MADSAIGISKSDAELLKRVRAHGFAPDSSENQDQQAGGNTDKKAGVKPDDQKLSGKTVIEDLFDLSQNVLQPPFTATEAHETADWLAKNFDGIANNSQIHVSDLAARFNSRVWPDGRKMTDHDLSMCREAALHFRELSFPTDSAILPDSRDKKEWSRARRDDYKIDRPTVENWSKAKITQEKYALQVDFPDGGFTRDYLGGPLVSKNPSGDICIESRSGENIFQLNHDGKGMITSVTAPEETDSKTHSMSAGMTQQFPLTRGKDDQWTVEGSGAQLQIKLGQDLEVNVGKMKITNGQHVVYQDEDDQGDKILETQDHIEIDEGKQHIVITAKGGTLRLQSGDETMLMYPNNVVAVKTAKATEVYSDNMEFPDVVIDEHGALNEGDYNQDLRMVAAHENRRHQQQVRFDNGSAARQLSGGRLSITYPDTEHGKALKEMIIMPDGKAVLKDLGTGAETMYDAPDGLPLKFGAQ